MFEKKGKDGIPAAHVYVRMKIRQAVDVMGFTYRELQDVCGVSAATIHRIYHESNSNGPTMKTCRRIIAAEIPYQPTLPGFEDVNLAD